MQFIIKKILLIFFVTLLFNACQTTDTNLAGVKHFYFEITDHVQNRFSEQLIQYLNKELPQYDYLISDESAAAGWPFYGQIERGKKVPKSAMMPPHTNVNRLSPITELTSYNRGEHTMKANFTIDYKNDSTLTVTKESFAWKDDQWHLFSKKLSTDFIMVKDTDDSVFSTIKKTLIRYTFK